MKFRRMKIYGSIYCIETKKKKKRKIAVYNSRWTENAREIFFFLKIKIFIVYTDKFPSKFRNKTRENFCTDFSTHSLHIYNRRGEIQ